MEAGRNVEVAVAATRIDIEHEMSGGFLHGRQDLWVRGQVVADEPVEQVSLQVGQHAAGSIFYGRRTTITTFRRPNGSLARHYVFAFNLRRPAVEAALSCRFAIIARGKARTASEDFVLASDHDGDAACRIVEGPTTVHASPARAPVVLYVERVAVALDGQFHVEGWVLSGSPIVTVHIFSGEERIGVAQLGRARPDVAKAHPDYPNAALSGFVFKARLGPEWYQVSYVRIEAASHDGVTQEVFCTVMPAQPPESARVAEQALPPPGSALDGRREIRMCIDDAVLDEAGQLAVRGWALSTVGITHVDVRLDGELVGPAEVALLREDVAEAHPANPMARFAGFRFAGMIGRTAGNPQHVTVTAVNGLDDMRDETALVRTGLADSGPWKVALSAKNADFRLEIDTPMVVDGAVARVVFGTLTIEGWALARSEVVEVAVSVDGVTKGKAHYGFPRSDVASAFPERQDGLRSGFKFRCPLRGLASGPHTVQLRATAADGQTAVQQFRIAVQEDVVVPSYAQIRRTLLPTHARLYAELLQASPHRMRFALLLRLGAGTTPADLAATLRSLAGQVCQEWRLRVVVGDDAAATLLREMLADGFAAIASQVDFIEAPAEHIVPPDERLFIGCLSPGDELGCDALAEVALFGLRHPDADVIYADESRISPAKQTPAA